MLYWLVDSEEAVVRDHWEIPREKADALNKELRAKGDKCRWVLFNAVKFDLNAFDADQDARERGETEANE